MQDYSVKFVPKLVGQFQNSPKLNALISALVGPLTVLENDADSLIESRWINTAFGAQLDGCGSIVGEPREGRNDDDYRLAIKFRVFVNISEGTPAHLIQGLKFLTDPTDCQYMEAYPASVFLFTDGLFIPRQIYPRINDLAPVSISNIPISVSYKAKPFRFAREPVPGELFVNSSQDYLDANGSDIQVGQSALSSTAPTLGGIVPAELDVGLGYLDVGGPTLAVYNPNTLTTLGHYNLAGVFQ